MQYGAIPAPQTTMRGIGTAIGPIRGLFGPEGHMHMRAKLRALPLPVLLLALIGAASAQETEGRKIALWIFEARIRSFAPGIDAAITVSDEQKTQLGGIYAEVFETNAVALANMVLQDSNTSFAQRQVATATIQQAQAEFRTRSRSVFTEAQRTLIDEVYAAFNRVYQAAQEEMVTKVTAGFAGELDQLLSAEQKQAVAKSKAEIVEAKRKAAGEETGGEPPQPASPE